ncbi:MAG: hypothetical protein HDT39_01345 [Lachnospiraceae bacterium]|nr:hypothetical protein [Lachnospiraceae bacterium]
MSVNERIIEIDEIFKKSIVDTFVSKNEEFASDILLNAVGAFGLNTGFNDSNFKIWLQEVVVEYFNEYYPVYEVTLGKYILVRMVHDDVLIIEDDSELNILKDWWD